MANLKVKVKTFDGDTLFSHKEIIIGSKTIETSVKTIPIEKITKKDTISDDARGINEIYFQANSSKFQQAKEKNNAYFQKKVQNALNKTQNGEINIVFANLQSIDYSTEGLRFLVDFL